VGCEVAVDRYRLVTCSPDPWTARDFVRYWLDQFDPSVTNTFYKFSTTLRPLTYSDFPTYRAEGLRKYKKMNKFQRCNLVAVEWRQMAASGA
jgi:hypothetical protein